jgi:hypothetical protein
MANDIDLWNDYIEAEKRKDKPEQRKVLKQMKKQYPDMFWGK